MICYNSDARQLGIYFSTLARFDHIVHDILSGKKKITRLSVITGEIKLIPKISLRVCSKNYELTRVCFILSPKLIKSSLENSQAIAGFPWWNPRNHGASKIQQNINFTLSMKRQTFFFSKIDEKLSSKAFIRGGEFYSTERLQKCCLSRKNYKGC